VYFEFRIDQILPDDSRRATVTFTIGKLGF